MAVGLDIDKDSFDVAMANRHALDAGRSKLMQEGRFSTPRFTCQKQMLVGIADVLALTAIDVEGLSLGAIADFTRFHHAFAGIVAPDFTRLAIRHAAIAAELCSIRAGAFAARFVGTFRARRTTDWPAHLVWVWTDAFAGFRIDHIGGNADHARARWRGSGNRGRNVRAAASGVDCSSAIGEAGLEQVKVRNLSGGIAAMHSAWRL